MRGLLVLLFTLLLLTSSITCDPATCVSACQLTLSKIVFLDKARDLPYYEGQCASSLRTKSVYVCSREYCPAHAIQPGLDQLNKTCIRYGGTALPPFSFISNITSDDVRSQFRVVDRSDYLTKLEVNDPAIPSQSLFEDGLRSVVCLTISPFHNSDLLTIRQGAYGTSMATSILYA